MKITLDMPDLHEAVKTAVENAMRDKQKELSAWRYFTLKETAELLQIKTSTLLDKRMPYLNEIEYSQNGKIFWFKKDSVEAFIAKRSIKKYQRYH
jgi:acyl-CoA reductase-like NAD-dependent aldehyde dehydrogenase